MLRSLVAHSLLFVAFSYSPNTQAFEFGDGDFIQPKIVGGKEAIKGEFPFIVSLQDKSGHFCGGSLIRKDWVLTAAHCVTDGPPSKVVIGLHNLSKAQGTESFRPSAVIIHPKNNPNVYDYDMALIRLDGESKFAPITLNRDEMSGKVDFITAGWGTTKEGGNISDKLMKVTVPFQTEAACKKAYPNQITSSMLCAGLPKGGKDSCQGDSGGPLIKGTGANTTLVGVVSWGEGCAQPKKFGVYGKVAAGLEWVEATAK